MLRARVILNEPVGLLDYNVPPDLVGAVRPGVAVRVPLGKRRTSAYVAELCPGAPPPGLTLRDLEGLDCERPALPPNLIALLLFVASYYGALHGDVLQAALPPLARRASTRLRLTPAGKAALQADAATAGLKAADLQVLHLASRLAQGFTVVALERELGLTRRAASARLRRLEQKGVLARVTKRGARARAAAPEQSVVLPGVAAEAPPPLTDAQHEVVGDITAAVDQRAHHIFLLQGVTGSGKTEVYLRAIAHSLELGRAALVLVPEIALTPQLGARFRDRFGARIATFHSGLTPRQRRDEWERVATGQARIGLGARSALFLPLRDLGIIVVDEEHETSFKQEEAPRYNARDLAVWRGRQENAVVILGSATPSLESRVNADAGRYRQLWLKERVHGRPLPQVECIDLLHAPRAGSGMFTVQLANAVEQTLSAGDQAVLFLNRRGFAPYVFCRDCGFVCRCGDCDVALTLHRRQDILLCHYCGLQAATPDACPSCLGHRMQALGLGTERLEAELTDLFGAVPIARLDRDTVRHRNDLEHQLERFRSGEARLLIGTQMVAKGHDFAGVTLVGVVAADASLNFPDFRAAERTFQLLTQVAGRAGRGSKAGRVLVQAYETKHYAITTAMQHDYEGFLQHELPARADLMYPPFAHLALLRLEGEEEQPTQAHAAALASQLRHGVQAQGLAVQVLGPASAPLARLKGKWRWHILLKGTPRSALHAALRWARGRAPAGIRQILDVDPVNML